MPVRGMLHGVVFPITTQERAERRMFEIFLTTYGGVFIAEIVGDKLLYTSGVLATRYSRWRSLRAWARRSWRRWPWPLRSARRLATCFRNGSSRC